MHFTLETAKAYRHFTWKKHWCDSVKENKRHFVDFWICPSPVYFLILLQSTGDIDSCALAPALALAVCAKVTAGSPSLPITPHWPCTEPHAHRHTTLILTYPWKWTIFQWQNGLKLVILAGSNQVKVDAVTVLWAQRNASAVLLMCNRAIMRLWPHGTAKKSLH